LYPQLSRASVVDQAWERIGVTGNHPIWSEDRHDYVAAMDLRIGERLKNLSGDTVWVQQKLPRPGPTPVYNLEVQDEHVYYVGANGVLAHNVGEDWCDASTRRVELSELFDGQNPRRGIQIGDRTVLHNESSGGARVFANVSDSEVKQYFSQLVGQSLPPPRSLGGGREIYMIPTPDGNFVLRNFSTSGTGRWTIDIPAAITGRVRREVKFD